MPMSATPNQHILGQNILNETGTSKEAANAAASNSNCNPTPPSPINSVHVASVAKSPATTAASTWAGWPIH
jgi:hypothetical protein